MTKYFVDANGSYVGGFDGAEPPEGSVEVPEAPVDARQIWSETAWGDIPVTVPDRVSARRFRMQLRIAGLLDQVTAWVATQDPLVQDAFEYSGEFVRSEPMMAAGFSALGFTPQQIDAFFVAAAQL